MLADDVLTQVSHGVDDLAGKTIDKALKESDLSKEAIEELGEELKDGTVSVAGVPTRQNASATQVSDYQLIPLKVS